MLVDGQRLGLGHLDVLSVCLGCRLLKHGSSFRKCCVFVWRLTTLLLSHKRCTKSSCCPLERGVKTRDIAVSGDLGEKGRFWAKTGGNVLKQGVMFYF